MKLFIKPIQFFIFFLGINPIALIAQNVNQPVTLTQYVFNEFSPGIVMMKSGEVYNQALNYNIVTNEMIFNNNGSFMAIAQPENVDTVFINNRKFIPLNKKFFEILADEKFPLLLEFTATIHEPGNPIGYGSNSSTNATSNLKSIISSGGSYALKLPDGYSVTPGYNYWILENGKLMKAGSDRQLIKIFPDKKDKIKDFIQKNHTNFSKREDMILLIQHLESH